MFYYLSDQSVTSIKNNKDRFSDLNGELLLDSVNQNKQRIDEIERNVVHNKQTHTFKIHLTLTSQYGDEEKDFQTNEISKNEEFITVSKSNKHKQRRTNDYNEKQNNDDDLCIIEPNLETMKKSNENYGRMLINSENRTSNIVKNNKSYRYTYQCDRHDIKYNNKSNKMMNENEGAKQKYDHPVGFDYWFVDKSRDVACYTRHIELYVLLCEPQNYPNNLCNIDIIPMKSNHLPPQQSIVLKFVPNYITNEEIKNEIGSAYKSIYNLEKMKGSMMEKSRHIRLGLTCSDEYKKIINSNGLTLNGQVMEVN
ncbi:unnamed protein product [Rotaria socialis]|uniref:Uncharacterized protein n=1 Tax=Rotaria socialis TaxID=392032 RepID=A0A817WL66_9BILA|nr:unnamed protein product [Rotaria socialis]